jgi:hypothetical protein
MSISKWIQDVKCFIEKEGHIPDEFLYTLYIVEKMEDKSFDTILAIMNIDSKNYQNLNIDLNIFAVFDAYIWNYKKLAKKFITEIKPLLPDEYFFKEVVKPIGYLLTVEEYESWLTQEVIEQYKIEKEYHNISCALLDLTSHKPLFDKIVKCFGLALKQEKQKWKPEQFIKDSWTELSTLSIK